MKTVLLLLAGATFVFGLGLFCGIALGGFGTLSELSPFHELNSTFHANDYTKILSQLHLNDEQSKQLTQMLQTVTNPQQQNQQLQSILTPDQQKQWSQLLSQTTRNDTTPHQQSFIPAPQK